MGWNFILQQDKDTKHTGQPQPVSVTKVEGFRLDKWPDLNHFKYVQPVLCRQRQSCIGLTTSDIEDRRASKEAKTYRSLACFLSGREEGILRRR